jgi:hypothetical protein
VVLADQPVGAAHLAIAAAAPIRDVMMGGVAEDVVGRLVDRHVVGGLGDHGRELALEIDLDPPPRAWFAAIPDSCST